MEYMTEAQALSEIYDDERQDDFDEFYKQLGKTVSKYKARYLFAKQAKVRDKIPCPVCGRVTVKTSYQMAFCSNAGRGNCKDKYWNTVDDQRRKRSYKYA